MFYQSLTPLTKRESLAESFMSKAVRLYELSILTRQHAHMSQSHIVFNQSCRERELSVRLEEAALWLLR